MRLIITRERKKNLFGMDHRDQNHATKTCTRNNNNSCCNLFSLSAAYDSCWLYFVIKFSLRLANTQLEDTLSKMFEKFMKHTAGEETRLACHTSVMVGWKILTMI